MESKTSGQPVSAASWARRRELHGGDGEGEPVKLPSAMSNSGQWRGVTTCTVGDDRGTARALRDASLVGEALDRGTLSANIEAWSRWESSTPLHGASARRSSPRSCASSPRTRAAARFRGGREGASSPARPRQRGGRAGAELFGTRRACTCSKPTTGATSRRRRAAGHHRRRAARERRPTQQDVTGEDPQARGEDTPLRPEEERPEADRPGGATGGQT